MVVQEDGVFHYHEHDFIHYLYMQLRNDNDIVISLITEGYSCRDGSFIFEELERFCDYTDYARNRISIVTGNMVEHHPDFNIIKDAGFWYEILLIPQWLSSNDLRDTWVFNDANKFGSFVGGSNWYRWWISAFLYTKHKDMTIQTFHSGNGVLYTTPSPDMTPDNNGIFELQEQCNIHDMMYCVDFMSKCPIIISDADSKFILDIQEKCVISANNDEFGYPIQFPANMNIIKEYKNVFVDIVQETSISDDTFFITEKTWRPIIAKRPFILMGGVFMLRNLKKLGFKTFDKWWNEGYDELGYRDRVLDIFNLIDHLSKNSPSQMFDMLNEMKEVLEHNYAVMQRLTINDISSQHFVVCDYDE
jgi:hypothetical protein